jgi:hypothetical protein
LFRNNGDGTFTDVTAESGLGVPVMAFNAQFCDIDNDGWLDIIQYLGPQRIRCIRCKPADPAERASDARLQQPRRRLPDRAGTGLTECWGSMSGNAADLNNDGYLDMALGNGGPLMDRVEPLVIYESDGETFRNVTFSAGLPPGKGTASIARTCSATADC